MSRYKKLEGTICFSYDSTHSSFAVAEPLSDKHRISQKVLRFSFTNVEMKLKYNLQNSEILPGQAAL